MTDYITSANFKARHGITVNTEDGRIAAHVTAASGDIDTICGRQFGPHVGVATARYFTPDSWGTVYVDDCYDITQVATDDGDVGTFSTTWTVTTDYLAQNQARSGWGIDGVGPDGATGWPTSRLLAVGGKSFPARNVRPSVKVTAKWGWTAVPAKVSEACYLMAHRLYYEVKVPGGVTAPNADFGLPGQTLAPQYTANRLLSVYRRQALVAG